MAGRHPPPRTSPRSLSRVRHDHDPLASIQHHPRRSRTSQRPGTRCACAEDPLL